MKDTTSEEDVSLPVPPVAQATEDVLDNFGPLIADDYRNYKQQFLEWLLTEGKDTYRRTGYSETTVQTTHYKVDETYRWVWKEKGEYTKEITPEEATDPLDFLARETPHPDGYVYTFEKCIRRLFKYRREHLNKLLQEWEHEIPLDTTDDTTNQIDPLYPGEMDALYQAALERYSVKSYNNTNMTPAERDSIKAHLAQRFGKPKSDIGPQDFKRANSWKVPSIIALTADTGLRPIEVGRAKVSWLDLENKRMIVPSKDATKNDESWTCVLSSKTVNSLRNWITERDSYALYDDPDALWLTKMGHAYSSGSLNDMLNLLLNEAGIDPVGRNLTWYSFRHGVATLWADEKGIYHAKNQLRHSNIETTLRYTREEGRIHDGFLTLCGEAILGVVEVYEPPKKPAIASL